MKSLMVVAAVAVLAVGCTRAPVAVEESPVPARKATKPAGSANGSGIPVVEAKVVQSHTVEKGDTLYSIAFRYSMDFKVLAAINGIREPYTIFPGQVLTIKTRGRPVVPKPKPDRSAVATVSPVAVPPPATASAAPPASPAPAPTAAAAAKPVSPAPPPTASPPRAAPAATRTVAGGSWRWPVSGKLLSPFNPDITGPKGISIGGEPGTTIYAARDGRVVYTGSSLVGYGQLVIVKHDEIYLSAYAHNSKVLAKEGDAVKAGDPIAEMGSTGAERTQLHFEVRRNGDPVDPLSVLPAP